MLQKHTKVSRTGEVQEPKMQQWEGDNTILTLQLGRYLISSYRNTFGGKKLSPGVGYLNNLDKLIDTRCQVKSNERILSPEVTIQGWKVVCANVVRNVGIEFEECLQKGIEVDDAYEKCSQSRLYAAKLHSFSYLFNRFADGVSKVSGNVYDI